MAVKKVDKLLPNGVRLDRGLLYREKEIGQKVVDNRLGMLLPALDHYESDEALFLVLQRAERSLRDIALPLSEAEAVVALVDITEGLQQLDAISVVHRDLNPRNILYHDGRWKIADFGVSRDEEIGTQSATWIGAGVPEYKAPELHDGKSPTKKTDLYALGCIAYELLTGRPPYEGPDRWAVIEAHRTKDIPGDPCTNPIINRLIRRLLAKNPADRPQDATDVVKRLRHLPLSPDQYQQAIARSLAAREAHKSREAAVLLQQLAEAEARRQQVEQGVADLRELFDAAHDAVQAVTADTKLHQGVADILVFMEDVRLEVGFQEVRPRLADDTMLILAWAHISTRNAMGFIKANFAYEQVGDRLAWRLYRFNRSQFATTAAGGVAGLGAPPWASDGSSGADDYVRRYGPMNGTHGLHRDIFLEDGERTFMLGHNAGHDTIHQWEITIDDLDVGSVITLFQEAIELRP